MRREAYSTAVSWYKDVHYWIKKQLGRPAKCELCGTTEATRYEWANVSGEYKYELADWKRMCRPCHRAYDKPTHCPAGHEYSPDNVYVAPKNGARTCLTCRKDNSRRWEAINRPVTGHIRDRDAKGRYIN